MQRIWPFLVVLTVLGTAGFARAAERVTAAAVWRPEPGFMARFHRECDAFGGNGFTDCFVKAMVGAGASPAAVAFARRLGGDGYLEALQQTRSPVAVAHIVDPFRANENNAWLLVNGVPPLIDVDNQSLLALAAMRQALAYREIVRRFPRASLWPEGRGASGPQIRLAGQEFVVLYWLRDFCHACAVVGRVRFAFNFDHAGRFLGTRLVSVEPGLRP